MIRRSLRALLAVMLVGCEFVSASAQSSRPMRVVLLVDSGTNTSQWINQFRAGLGAFVDGLPPDAEVAYVTSGGQLQVKVQPTTDREKLHKEIDRFSSVGGANQFVDSLLEADKRFLKPAKDRWHVFVVLTTDNAEVVAETRIDEYNRFMRDFQSRGGVAHAILLKGRNTGAVTDVMMNLTTNTQGTYDPIAIGNGIPDKMKALANRLAEAYKTRNP